MDDRRFDSLAKALGAGASRRAAVAGLLAAVGLADAAEAKPGSEGKGGGRPGGKGHGRNRGHGHGNGRNRKGKRKDRGEGNGGGKGGGACVACKGSPEQCGAALQQAIAAAADGATVRACAGRFGAEAGFTIDKPLTLEGAGDGDDPDADTILEWTGDTDDLTAFSPVLTIAADGVELVGVRIRGGRDGGIWVGQFILDPPNPPAFTSGTLTATACTIVGNGPSPSKSFGGGIVLYPDSQADLTDCTVADNQAYIGAGLSLWPGAQASLTDCAVADNAADSMGGGIANSGGTVVLVGTAIEANTAESGRGGGIANTEGGEGTPETTVPGVLELRAGATVAGNAAGIEGGGIYNGGGGVAEVQDGAAIEDNESTNGGGGIYNSSDGDVTVRTGARVAGNTTDLGADGIFNDGGTATVEQGAVVENNGECNCLGVTSGCPDCA